MKGPLRQLRLIAERNAGLFAEISDFRRARFCGIVPGA
jgi:hypothetical protein